MYRIKNNILPLIGGTAIQLCIGIIYIWSVFQLSVIEYYNWSVSNTSYVFSIMMASFVLGIIIGGKINNKDNSQLIIFLGSFIFTLGIFLTSFIPHDKPWLIYVFYGIIAGFGNGVVYTVTISCIQKWWAHRKGFATGIIICAYGASTVIFTPLVNYLISPDVLGLLKTFRYLSIGFFIVITIFIWFIKDPPKEYYKKRFLAEKFPMELQKQFTNLELIKTKQYYLLLLCLLFLTPAFYILNPLLKSLGELRGLPEFLALTGVMITGVASASGRLTIAMLSDKIGRENVLYVLYSISLLSSLLLIFAKGYLFIVLIFFIAYAYGGATGVIPTIVSDYFGMKNLGSNFGLVMIAVLISVLLFPRIANIVSIDGYPSAFTFIIPVVSSIAGIFCVHALKPVKVKRIQFNIQAKD